MKSALSFVVFASAFIAVVLAYPGGRPSGFKSDAEIGEAPIIVLSEISDPLEDGFGGGFFGSIRENPLNGVLTSIQSMMNRLRQQIAQSLPTYSDHGGFFGFTNIPEGANTTSTTKVINGHVVTVNETTYENGDAEHGTFFRVRIVDIKPENDDVTGNPDAIEIFTAGTDDDEATTSSSTDRSVESVEDITNNEIPERLVNKLRIE